MEKINFHKQARDENIEFLIINNVNFENIKQYFYDFYRRKIYTIGNLSDGDIIEYCEHYDIVK
jgi:hypothetical protein